ncbi:MAG: D-alanine--D-alanine ligase [Thermodesulfobacteriota bacterium]
MLRVALLSGGTSSERDVSLSGGDQVFTALDKSRYEIVRYDPKFDLARLVADAPKLDAALIILHGPFGEDGTIQGLLDLLGIPYQGSGVLGSSLAMDKCAAKRMYQAAGIPTPAFFEIGPEDAGRAPALAEQIGYPLVVKPSRAGSSVGMSIVKSPDQLPGALALAFENDRSVLLEQYVKGVEITGAVIGNDTLAALPLVEIVPGGGHEYFDYKAKYTKGESAEICPARIPEDVARRARELAVKSHRALFLRGYSRTDMLVRGDELFVLETNTIPGMTPVSLLPLAAAAAGMNFSALLDRLIELALEDRKK